MSYPCGPSKAAATSFRKAASSRAVESATPLRCSMLRWPRRAASNADTRSGQWPATGRPWAFASSTTARYTSGRSPE